MSLFDRRKLLTCGLAFAGLSGCGFAPAYGPQGGAQRLQRQVALNVPTDRNGYLLNRRLEERLGRAEAAAYDLTVTVTTDRQGLGSTQDGRTTRFHLLGNARMVLRAAGGDQVLFEGATSAFTAYSTTGSTVATLAAERDASERLMVILADQITDWLIGIAASLPQA
ncbi:LPS assembly lipoprotein LptE [Mesobacterium sp. TK19101]|uniref:LPS assembly lipoprotein LptE n=1 Tax=Mesobacterium hydrothermale TaxID=3111907 RepID=A0ABU6HES4_9RHOB|nr:LPS assembly lipoprotein LptE [Mesobacterium sp. TK19101]MEC3860881.1 LPS assembly lipoprotein LptE [Mesobacterium sp. TK19101]